MIPSNTLACFQEDEDCRRTYLTGEEIVLISSTYQQRTSIAPEATSRDRR